MKNKRLYLLNALFLSACAAPTSSLDLANQQIDKTGYIFYQNSEINLHISELKDRLVLPAEEYAVPDISIYSQMLKESIGLVTIWELIFLHQ